VLERDDVGLRVDDGRVRAGEVELERFWVDAEQQIARSDALVFLHLDLDDLAADLGTDSHHVLLDVGIVGRNLALQTLPVEQAPDEEKHGQRYHRREPAPTSAGGRRYGFGLFVVGNLRVGFRHRDLSLLFRYVRVQ